MPRLLRQPRFPQTLFVPRVVFGPPLRSLYVSEIGNAQSGIELPQPCHCFLCLLQPSCGEAKCCHFGGELIRASVRGSLVFNSG
jgi:hypothetical protein